MTTKEYNNFCIQCNNAIHFVRTLRKIPVNPDLPFSQSFPLREDMAFAHRLSGQLVELGFDETMEELIVKALENYKTSRLN